MTDADYVDDLAFLANTPIQSESLLHSPEKAAEDIGLYINANKTEIISTQNGKPLKTCSHTSAASTESDVNLLLAKTWTTTDSLSIILKSDLYDKIKRDFFQAVAVTVLPHGCATWTLIKRIENKVDENYTRTSCVILKIIYIDKRDI